MATFTPAYRELLRSGELHRRVEQARDLLRPCRVCPRGCGVDRLAGEWGTCRVGAEALVSSFGPHFGEEPPLVGSCGSGTIFFARCSLKCIFCQNYEISQWGCGDPTPAGRIAACMLALQRRGCHNINLVTPTHIVPQILAAVEIAAEGGLTIPLVYNSGGYESIETLRLLDGAIDLYMPDLKYADAAIAERLSGVENYPDIAKAAILEMHRQVGDLRLDERGIARRGLIVRHLVLPNGLAGTQDLVRFLTEEVSRDTYLNLMDQYHPCYKAHKYPQITRRLTRREYDEAVQMALDAGLTRLA